jgi:hypothetical protein
MKRQRRKSLVEKKRLRNLEIWNDKLSVEYGRHAVNLIKAEDRMNREAARLEKTRNRHKPAYIS